MKFSAACVIVYAIHLAAVPVRGQSEFVAELMRLNQERDKALAAAAAPVNKKYQTSLDDLLRRATKAGDLDAALKIRAAIESLTAAKAAAIDPAEVRTKRALQKALVGTSWSLASSREEARTIKTVLTFINETDLTFQDGKKDTWTVVDDRTIKIGPSSFLFDAALQSFQCPDWYNSGPRVGIRRERP